MMVIPCSGANSGTWIKPISASTCFIGIKGSPDLGQKPPVDQRVPTVEYVLGFELYISPCCLHTTRQDCPSWISRSTKIEPTSAQHPPEQAAT